MLFYVRSKDQKMKYCSKRTKKYIFGLVKWGFQPHLFLITNAFYTLEDQNHLDVVRTCQFCSFKDVLSLDQETLLEVVRLYPSAFKDILREYLQTWI